MALMDVLLVAHSAFELPTSLRVAAIAHDGAGDLRLWPGPGPDRELAMAYGDQLADVLEDARAQLPGGQLELGKALRIHPGRLHCDFLMWLASRPSEPGVEQEPAPGEPQIARLVESALEFAASRHASEVALPAIGSGRDALDETERLVAVVAAANRYEEQRFAAGRPPVVERILVCHPKQAVLSAVRRRVQSQARVVASSQTGVDSAPRKTTVRGQSTARRPRKTRTPTLDPQEVATARVKAAPYSWSHQYAQGEWLLHPKFGAGQVREVTPEGGIVVLFEDGNQRRMVHAR